MYFYDFVACRLSCERPVLSSDSAEKIETQVLAKPSVCDASMIFFELATQKKSSCEICSPPFLLILEEARVQKLTIS